MNWQEYQEAVARLYEQFDALGRVRRNVYIPDRVTGQRRQVDVLVELAAKGHRLSIMVDAKYYSVPIDTKVIEGVTALGRSIGASKVVIVTANGWTAPAARKAEHLLCDLRLLTIEDALDLVVPDKWMMCPHCHDDCIVLDQPGWAPVRDGTIIWWLTGRCRACNHGLAWCQDCGECFEVRHGDSVRCLCGYEWSNDSHGIRLLSAEGSWRHG